MYIPMASGAMLQSNKQVLEAAKMSSMLSQKHSVKLVPSQLTLTAPWVRHGIAQAFLSMMAGALPKEMP